LRLRIKVTADESQLATQSNWRNISNVPKRQRTSL
jgi:hypothetical protein